MDEAKVDVTALENLIADLQTVEDALNKAAASMKHATDLAHLSRPYWRKLYWPMPPDADPETYQPVERDPPEDHKPYDYTVKLDAWSQFRSEYEPILRRVLGFAYDMQNQMIGGWGGNVLTFYGVLATTFDASALKALPALTPGELTVEGTQIGSLVASGAPQLSADQWLYMTRYGQNPDFVSAMMAKCTMAQLAACTAAQSSMFSSGTIPYGDPGAKATTDLYSGRVAALGQVAATWSGLPGVDQSKVAGQIVDALQGKDGIGPATGMSLLISFGKFATPVVTQVAIDMYNWDQTWYQQYMSDMPGLPMIIYPGDIGLPNPVVYPNGVPVTDVMTGVMAMLSNNPEAGTAFFTGGDPVQVTIKGKVVNVDPRILWALNRPWADDAGAAAGGALRNAAAPLPAADGTVTAPDGHQVQVASQIISGEALLTWGHPEYQPQVGIGNGVASTIAAYSVDVMDIVNGWPTLYGLDVTYDALGLTIQAVSHDPANPVTIIKGWSDQLGLFLTQNIPDVNPPHTGYDQDLISGFLSDPSRSLWIATPGVSGEVLSLPGPAAVLAAAGQGLGFITHNAWKTQSQLPTPGQAAMQAWAGGLLSAAAGTAVGIVSTPVGIMYTVGELTYSSYAAAQAAAAAIQVQHNVQQTNQTADQAVPSAVHTWIGVLTQKGYLTPDTIQQWNATNRDNQWTVPIIGVDMVQQPDGTWIYREADVADRGGGSWANQTGTRLGPYLPQSAGNQILSGTGYGNQDTDQTVPRPWNVPVSNP